MANSFDSILQNPGLNHITIKVFESLDFDSLIICVQVSPDWQQFIKENEKDLASKIQYMVTRFYTLPSPLSLLFTDQFALFRDLL